MLVNRRNRTRLIELVEGSSSPCYLIGICGQLIVSGNKAIFYFTRGHTGEAIGIQLSASGLQRFYEPSNAESEWRSLRNFPA